MRVIKIMAHMVCFHQRAPNYGSGIQQSAAARMLRWPSLRFLSALRECTCMDSAIRWHFQHNYSTANSQHSHNEWVILSTHDVLYLTLNHATFAPRQLRPRLEQEGMALAILWSRPVHHSESMENMGWWHHKECWLRLLKGLGDCLFSMNLLKSSLPSQPPEGGSPI